MDYFGLLRVACSQFVGPFVAMSSLIARTQLFVIIDGKAIGLGEFERRDFQVAKGKEGRKFLDATGEVIKRFGSLERNNIFYCFPPR